VMPRIGPKPLIVAGSMVAMVGFGMFIVARDTVTSLTIDSAVAFAGMIMVMIPMVNMISVDLPCESITVGLGFNSMLRNLGGAMGPVVATTVMSTFTVTIFTMTVPSSTAFDVIFGVGIAMLFVILLLNLAVRNYVFKDGVLELKSKK